MISSAWAVSAVIFFFFFESKGTQYSFSLFFFFYQIYRENVLLISFKFFFLIYFYLFIAVLGLRFCARAFSSCGKRGPLFIAVRGPLTIAASLVVEHRLQMHRLSNCGSRAQLLRGMWDIPGPGLEPVSPALAGGFLTLRHQGSPQLWSLRSWLAIDLQLIHLPSPRPISPTGCSVNISDSTRPELNSSFHTNPIFLFTEVLDHKS